MRDQQMQGECIKDEGIKNQRMKDDRIEAGKRTKGICKMEKLNQETKKDHGRTVRKRRYHRIGDVGR